MGLAVFAGMAKFQSLNRRIPWKNQLIFLATDCNSPNAMGSTLPMGRARLYQARADGKTRGIIRQEPISCQSWSINIGHEKVFFPRLPLSFIWIFSQFLGQKGPRGLGFKGPRVWFQKSLSVSDSCETFRSFSKAEKSLIRFLPNINPCNGEAFRSNP